MKEISYIAKLEGSLRLSAEGEWFHNGEPFQNKKLSDLFLRSVVWDNMERRFFIEIGPQRATFDIEDTAYFIISIDDSVSPWLLHLSDGTTETLQTDSLSISSRGPIYCTVKMGLHKAKFLRSAHQLLSTHVVGDNEIVIGGERITLK